MTDLVRQRPAVRRDRDEPHTAIDRIGLTLDELACLELVDYRTDRGTTNAEAVGEIRLRRSAELGDVAEQAGLRQMGACFGTLIIRLQHVWEVS